MSGSVARRALRSHAAIEAALTVIVAIVAYQVVSHSLRPYYHAAPWIEDLLLPCTGRPGWVPDPAAVKALPQWQAFTERQTEYFPCSAITGMPLVEVGISWERQAYFHRALGVWFRIVGPKIDGFITFHSVLYALTSAFAYLVFRLGLCRMVALGCAAGLVWSPSHLWSAGLPIEYAKAPWILATVWLCGVMLRRDKHGQSLLVPALASGLVAGVGIGFKTDVMAAVLLAVATTLVFVRRHPGGWRRRAVATLCVVAGVGIGGGTMIYRNLFSDAGSLLPIQFLGGQDWVTEALHATNPLYDYGLVFDDSHMTVLLNSYGRRVLATTDAVYFFGREMQEIATRLLIDFWTTFPGDLVLRVIAATIRVLQLSGFGLVAAVAGLALVFARDLRAGWFVTFVTLYLSAYVSLVFQRRHFFHLEFISWWLVGFLLQAILLALRELLDAKTRTDAFRRVGRPAVQAMLCLSLIGACGFAALAMSRAYQRRQVERLIEGYLQTPLDERSIDRVAHEPGAVTLRIGGISLRELDSDADQTGDYLVARFTCRDARPILVTAAYLTAGATWDRTFSVPCAGSRTTSTLMVPVYQYGRTYVFDGLKMNTEDADTVQSVSAMPPDPEAKLWPDLLLPADWRTRDMVGRLKIPPEMPLQ